MKNGYIYMLLVLFVHAGCRDKSGEKYFTGLIEYAYTYSSDSVNADSLSNARPVKSIFRYDLDDYQSQFLGKDTTVYYYSGRLGKAVSAGSNGLGYECEDYTVATDSVISWRLYDTGEKVLEQNCSVLELQKMNSWVKYYISKEKKVSPSTYQKHRAYNWDIYGEKAGGGVILKLEHRFKYFSMMGTATMIKEEAGDFKALELGEDQILTICNKIKQTQ
ncbi:MAG: hypothetical protein KTQ13_05985 [Ferruginibacter sp.]|nr:hypothetical protein [Chitinophagaceae bacterium]MBP6285686.1 hypothetical protein [Ferruginibacter sp.]MBU9936183.1 hypothetical protein [Ferruginibacter sp.]